MPLHADVLGAPAGSLDVVTDARWAMAYAAGVPDERPELYDTAGSLTVHPMLAVAVEWQLLMAHRAGGSGLTPDEVRRGIHVGHDLVLGRPLRADEQLRVEARTVAVGRRRAGATQTMLFSATDAAGATVWRTKNTSLFLGVELFGEAGEESLDWPSDALSASATGQPVAPTGQPVAEASERTRPVEPAAPPATAGAEPLAVRTSFVRTIDAHVYSECARIWNPIHTDVVAARRAGLAAPILHGTATLARAVSIVSDLVDMPLADVRRITGGFKAPVDLGTSIKVRVLAVGDRHATFDVITAAGTPALTAAHLAW